MRKRRKRQRWSVMLRNGYVAGDGGGPAWTFDRAEADEVARDMEGTVVDTVHFAEHWGDYRNAGKVEPSPSELLAASDRGGRP